MPDTSRRGGRRPGAGAPRGNLNTLRSGERTRALQPFLRALGPLGKLIFLEALEQAMDDALRPLPDTRDRASATARRRARDHALRRVLTCARDAGLVDGMAPLEIARRLNEAFRPIWVGTDATLPEHSTAQQPRDAVRDR